MLLLSLLMVFKHEGGLRICIFFGLNPMITDMLLIIQTDSQPVEEAKDMFPSYCGILLTWVGGEVNPPYKSFPDFLKQKIY